MKPTPIEITRDEFPGYRVVASVNGAAAAKVFVYWANAVGEEVLLDSDAFNLASKKARAAFVESLDVAHREPVLALLREASADVESERTADDAGDADDDDDDDGGSAGDAKQKQSDLLLALVREDNVELWHTPAGVAYASVTVSGRRQHMSVASRDFRRYLRWRYFDTYGNAPTKQAVEEAQGVLDSQAQFAGEEHEVYLRTASVPRPEGDALYLDLGDDTWRAIKITAKGWEVVSDPPVRFRRVPGMLPLPEPERGGSVNDLLPFLNLSADEEERERDFALIVAFLLMALRDKGPFPILTFVGEAGSAKSSGCRTIRGTADPSSVDGRSMPKSERDLAITAHNNWLLCFDNQSRITDAMSDALCRTSTGGGLGTRTLYSDDEETVFSGSRPVVMNGITELARRGDLRDRSLVVALPRIRATNRRTEKVLQSKFEAARPKILGALLDAMVVGLRELPAVTEELKQLPRMADFTLWAVATERGLPWKPETIEESRFLAAYRSAREAAVSATISESVLAKAVIAFADEKLPHVRNAWVGTPTELFKMLSDYVSDLERRSDDWPKGAGALSGELTRLASDLETQGVMVMRGRSGNHRADRRITIVRTKLPEPPSDPGGKPSAGSSASSAAPNPNGDTHFSADDAADDAADGDDQHRQRHVELADAADDAPGDHRQRPKAHGRNGLDAADDADDLDVSLVESRSRDQFTPVTGGDPAGRVAAYLRGAGRGVRAEAVAEATGLSAASAFDVLRQLEQRGAIVSAGSGTFLDRRWYPAGEVA